MTTIRALLVSGRKLELELSHTRLGPPVRYEYSTPTATSYTSVILALPTATRRVAPRPPPSRCASPRPRQCQSVTPPPSPPVVPAPSVRAGFPGNSLDHTPDAAAAQGRQGGLAAWPHWLWLSTRLPRANASGHPTTCRRRTAPPGSSSALGSASAAACGWSQRGGLRHFGRRNRSTSTPPRAPLPVTRQSSRRPGGALG